MTGRYGRARPQAYSGLTRMGQIGSGPGPQYGRAAIHDTAHNRMIVFGEERERVDDFTTTTGVWSFEFAATTSGALDPD